MGDGDMVVPVKGDILCSVNSVLFLQGLGYQDHLYPAALPCLNLDIDL